MREGRDRRPQAGPVSSQLILPKTAIPTVGYFACLIDTEGNLLGVMQADKNAK